MSYRPNHEERLVSLEQRLRSTQAVTAGLMAELIAHGCVRFAACGGAARTRINRLIESGAWIDAALALTELELPQWKLRRLVCDGGEWHCALSKQPALPAALDDTAEARHESLPLAILLAFIEALRQQRSPSPVSRLRTVAEVRPVLGYAVCCDNFA